MSNSSRQLKHLQEVIHSEGWALILERIGLTVEREIQELLKDQPPEATAKRRGAIQMAKVIASIPNILAEELRTKVAAEQ